MSETGSSTALAVKRAIFCIILLLILGFIGGFCALTATNPKIPHPWGEIRLMQYSTNSSGQLQAHFRFRNLFEWPVHLEIGLEVRVDRQWEMARGYSLFVPIEKPVASRDGQNFAVPVPLESKEWRVLVRAAKAELTKMDVRREQIKNWLESHGGRSLAERIQIDEPGGHILPGPEMKYHKPGRLATAH